MSAFDDLGDSIKSIFRKDIIGGVIPGCVLLLETYLIWSQLTGGDGFKELHKGWIALSGANLLSSAMFIVFFASMGWMAGWLVRKIGFAIIGIKGVRWIALWNSGLPSDTGDVLRSLSSADRLGYDDAARTFPWWPKDPSAISDDTVLFHKAKQWLVRHDQENAVTDKEATINALTAMIPVFLVGTFVLWSVSPGLAVSMLVLSFVITGFAVRERCHEEFDIFRNFINSNSYLGQEKISPTLVPWDLFESLFRDSHLLRTKFDWEGARYLAVRLEVLSAIPSNWYTVWYSGTGASGTVPSSYDMPGAIPLTIGKAAMLGDELSAERVQAIQALTSDLVEREVSEFMIVAWRTPSGRTVILDGNHRAVASHVAGLDTRASVFVIYGPADGRIVPDLVHHN